MEESTQTLKNPLSKNKPMILNATHPDKLLSPSDIEVLIRCLRNRQAEDRGWKHKQPSIQEQANMTLLLELARFHGYYPNRIEGDGIKWGCMVYRPNRKKTAEVIISIISCADCTMNFHSYHYEDEDPVDIKCEKCRLKILRKPITPLHLKSIPKIRKTGTQYDRQT